MDKQKINMIGIRVRQAKCFNDLKEELVNLCDELSEK